MYHFIIFYKKYEECPMATTISMVASASIFLGIISTPLFILTMRDSSWLYGNLYIGIIPLVFFVLGILGKIYAPKCAHKIMVKRITENLEYGRYIAHKYPKYSTLVKELQPMYNEEDSRPITDYLVENSLKQAEKLKRKAPLLVLILILLGIFISYLNK
ncbi:hypothetical protein [Amedibacillus sp. YH-ame10]